MQVLKDCDQGRELAPQSYLQTPTDEDEPTLKMFKHLSNIVLEKQKAQATAYISQLTHPCSPQVQQLRTYLEDKFCKWDESLDTLDFWVQNEEKYPDLAPVILFSFQLPVCYHLAVLAESSSSEEASHSDQDTPTIDITTPTITVSYGSRFFANQRYCAICNLKTTRRCSDCPRSHHCAKHLTETAIQDGMVNGTEILEKVVYS